MRALTWSLALCACACGVRLEAGAPDDADPDAPADVPALGPWGTPEKIATASTTAAEDDGTLSSSGLELVFAKLDPTDGNRKHLFYAERDTTLDGFGTPTRLPFNVNGTPDETPRFSADDRTLYFASARAPTLGGLDIWQVSHPGRGALNWGTPAKVDGVSSAAVDKWFMPCGNQGRYLIIVGLDIAEGVLGDGPPTVDTNLSAPAPGTETGTFVTPDCRTVYFASTRVSPQRMVTSSRGSIADPWPPPTVVEDFELLGGDQQDPWLAGDQRTFVFVSNVSGSNDVYISTR